MLIILVITACTGPAKPIAVQPISVLPSGSDGYAWWNDTTFYEIFVRSFYDSNGNGIGDINGIIQKLDYLNDGDPKTNTDLGVTGIWLKNTILHPKQLNSLMKILCCLNALNATTLRILTTRT